MLFLITGLKYNKTNFGFGIYIMSTKHFLNISSHFKIGVI